VFLGLSLPAKANRTALCDDLKLTKEGAAGIQVIDGTSTEIFRSGRGLLNKQSKYVMPDQG
jgi:hypothetical protein